MQNCAEYQNILTTYVALSDWIKALWLITPTAFLLAFAWIVVNRPRGA